MHWTPRTNGPIGLCLLCVLAFGATILGGSGGSALDSAAAKAKTKKCKPGYVKKKVRGKAKCVRIKCKRGYAKEKIKGKTKCVRIRTLYVSTSGNDLQSGAPDQPLRTIGRALALSEGGERILVEPGDYPFYQDTKRRLRPVVVQGVTRNGLRPTMDGIGFAGGEFVTLRNLAFTDTIEVWNHPTGKFLQVAHGIVVEDSDLTGPTVVCMTIHSGGYDVTVRRNRIHDCGSGLTGPESPGQSHDIDVVDNRFERFGSAAMSFAHWHDVVIARNHMSRALDPAGIAHNDLIQASGDVIGLVIRRNVLHDCSQIVFVKPDLGPISDVLVENNLIYDSRSNAVTTVGAPRVRIVNNTIWGSATNGLRILGLISGAPYAVLTNDTVVVNNIIDNVTVMDGAVTAQFEHNLTSHPVVGAGPTNLVRNPRFVDPAAGRFRLQAGSPALGAASRRMAPARDLGGRLRRRHPTIGAIECPRRAKRKSPQRAKRKSSSANRCGSKGPA